MKVVGLITEYNPFHKGHLFHVQKSKEITGADYCIVVMSGNFVQRGEPAIVDKWTRARIALRSGIDAVIELPVHYATASAEFFATASVALLTQTGIVDAICFGSESGALEELFPIAHELLNESTAFQSHLEDGLEDGLRFPVARAKAIEKQLGIKASEIINSPNNILGIEYLKALKKLNSPIKPYTIKRLGAHYHDPDHLQPIASASAIRKYLLEDQMNSKIDTLLPAESYEEMNQAILNKRCPVFMNDFFSLLQYKLLNSSPAELSKIQDVTEGLEHRFLRVIQGSKSMDEFLALLATKRYTNTKLSRALIHILLHLDQQTLQIFNQNGYAQYIKVLGFQQKSQIIMQAMKKNANLPLIVNTKDSMKHLTSLQLKMLNDEIRATNIYNTVVQMKCSTIMKNDYTQPFLTL